MRFNSLFICGNLTISEIRLLVHNTFMSIFDIDFTSKSVLDAYLGRFGLKRIKPF